MDPITATLAIAALLGGIQVYQTEEAKKAAEEAALAENDRAVREKKAMFDRSEREARANRAAISSFSSTQKSSILGTTSSPSGNTTILGS